MHMYLLVKKKKLCVSGNSMLNGNLKLQIYVVIGFQGELLNTWSNVVLLNVVHSKLVIVSAAGIN